MFLFTSPISVNISEVFVYLLPIRSFPDSPKYRADPISDPVIGSGLINCCGTSGLCPCKHAANVAGRLYVTCNV